jgi:hypothetical protein
MKLWLNGLIWLPVACACFASCGDSDSKKHVAGDDGGRGGEGGMPGNSAGGSEMTAGQAGTPSVPSAGVGGQVGQGGVPVVNLGGAGAGAGAGGEGIPPLVCIQIGDVATGGVGGDPYGGAQWKDFATNSCQSCPTTPLKCNGLAVNDGAVYDPATGLLTLRVAPSVTEIVSADFHYSYSKGVDYVSDITTAAQVNENELVIPIGVDAAKDFDNLNGDILYKDGCGDESSFNTLNDYFSIYLVQPTATGGAAGAAPLEYQISCNSD